MGLYIIFSKILGYARQKSGKHEDDLLVEFFSRLGGRKEETRVSVRLQLTTALFFQNGL